MKKIQIDKKILEKFVHHIKKLRLFKCYKEANKEDNLVTLCRRCHGIVENNGMDFEFKRI